MAPCVSQLTRHGLKQRGPWRTAALGPRTALPKGTTKITSIACRFAFCRLDKLLHTRVCASQPGGGLGPSMRTEASHRSTAQRSGPTSPEGTITPRRSPLSHTVRLHAQTRQNKHSHDAGL